MTGIRSGQIVAIGADGIWEASSRDHKRFGRSRFRDLLRTNAHLPARHINDAIYRELKVFSHGLKQADDVTLVVMKIQDLPPISCDWQI